MLAAEVIAIRAVSGVPGMHKLFRTALAAAITLVASAPSLAAEVDPLGLWELKSGDSRFDFTYCGDGTRLCAKVVWLNDYQMTTPARKQLGTNALEQAVHVGANTWKGPMTYDGHTATATLSFTSPDNLVVSGCYLMFFCKSYELKKVSK
jgi:uncharacterized protein (DUF2147 family)